MSIQDAIIAVGGGIFTAAAGVVAYVLRQVQFQFDQHDKRIEALSHVSAVTSDKLQRLEVADARHEERSEDIFRRIEDLKVLVHAQSEETRIQGLTLANISAKIDQLLIKRQTESPQ